MRHAFAIVNTVTPIMLKIHRGLEGQECVVFVLSGRIQSEETSELRKLISVEKQKIAKPRESS